MLEATLPRVRPSRLDDPGRRGAGRGRRRHRGVARLRDLGRARARAPATARRPGVHAAHHALRAQGLRGAGEAAGGRWARSTAPTASARPGREKREREAAELGYKTQPYVLVVGGGQGGIALGARLRQLGVPTIIVDKHPRPGDQWRNRYKSLCLHDPVWYDHLPYLKFPDNWPVFSPKDKIADWLESYTKVMELNYWANTEAKSASYDEATGEWTVTVEREGKPVVLRPKQLVLATGMSGKPNVPDFPGMDVFRGDQHHSSAHPGPDAYRGKKCVVVGSNNSAFDICGALWENGADVTMVQRSSTHIVQLRLADGDRARRALLGGGGRSRRHDGEGRSDLRLAPLPDPAHLPDPGVRGDGRARPRLLPAPGEVRLRPRLGRRRLRAVHEVPAPRFRLLHRRGCGRPRRERGREARQGPGRPPHRALASCSRTGRSSKRTWSSTRRATAR